MNQADSERLESAMNQLGLNSTSEAESADVIVLNSCVVRQSAEDRVVGNLTRLAPLKTKNPDLIFALMGCMVGPKSDALKKTFPHVDVFMRPQQFDPLIDLISDRKNIDKEGCIGILEAKPAVATYVPIIHGCDKFCTFCIIPYRRGREKSRPPKELVKETEMLVRRGVKEITLLGQNVDSYGHDLEGDIDLGHLFEEIESVEELKRIRFLTSHPNDMSMHIIESIASLDKVCEHINLPIQAGSNSVLYNMRRGYNRDQYLDKIQHIRDNISNVSLSTDIIVGFCGESDKDFDETLDIIKSVRFDKVHAAVYSNRPGTIAARKFDNDVPEEVKRERFKALEDLQKQISTEINQGYMHSIQDVLVEEVKGNRAKGRSRNDKIVHFEGGSNLIGEIVQVEINKTGAWSLQGSKVSTPESMVPLGV
jgi:tRNA-2-methylthio-N6-dimethylallyladenosine synthase